MTIEIWRDVDGYRLAFESNEFDLTAAAFDKLLGFLGAARMMDEVGDYRVLTLDLSEEEQDGDS